MGTGIAKGEMAKTEKTIFFLWPCSLKELVLARIPNFSLNQTDIQYVESVVSCKKLRQGLIMGYCQMPFISLLSVKLMPNGSSKIDSLVFRDLLLHLLFNYFIILVYDEKEIIMTGS